MSFHLALSPEYEFLDLKVDPGKDPTAPPRGDTLTWPENLRPTVLPQHGVLHKEPGDGDMTPASFAVKTTITNSLCCGFLLLMKLLIYPWEDTGKSFSHCHYPDILPCHHAGLKTAPGGCTALPECHSLDTYLSGSNSLGGGYLQDPPRCLGWNKVIVMYDHVNVFLSLLFKDFVSFLHLFSLELLIYSFLFIVSLSNFSIKVILVL